ncbi:MAG: right-handed parallel beta-helix repeat-containing protein, partial [Usitatibacter sp.]
MAALPAAAVQRSFVASSGSDGNSATNCGFSAPCRGFTAALGVTDPGGEVVALDAAGYGTITITKSVTITANPGFYAGIAASAGNAVTIATGGVNVILRGLNINGIGGVNGVSMTSGTSLTIENCVISNFSASGVVVNVPAAVRISDSTVRGNFDGILAQGSSTVDISRSSFKGNSHMGVLVTGNLPAVTSATVSDSTATGNGSGFSALTSGGAAQLAVSRSTASYNTTAGIMSGGSAVVSISGSIVTGNGIGLDNTGGTLESQGENTVRLNGSNTAGSIVTFAGT